MKPAPFAYVAPRSLAEALVLMARHGDEGKALAGGQSLLPVLNFRLAQPAVLVDLNGVAELAFLAAACLGTTAAGGVSALSPGRCAAATRRGGWRPAL